MRGHEATKEKHDYFKNIYLPVNALERAFRWYYLNRTSYSGIMNVVNCYWGYGDKFSMQPKNWPTQLRKCSAKLQGASLLCGDFATVIEQAPDGAFLFIDPPYYNADQAKFYTFAFTKADHHRLAELMQQHSKRLRFLLTYDDSPEIRGLYGWAEIILVKQWNYTINRTDDQKKERQRPQSEKGTRYMGREVFILNYDPSCVGQVPVAHPQVGSMVANVGHLRAAQLAFAE